MNESELNAFQGQGGIIDNVSLHHGKILTTFSNWMILTAINSHRMCINNESFITVGKFSQVTKGHLMLERFVELSEGYIHMGIP